MKNNIRDIALLKFRMDKKNERSIFLRWRDISVQRVKGPARVNRRKIKTISPERRRIRDYIEIYLGGLRRVFPTLKDIKCRKAKGRSREIRNLESR